jgi:hypothetical protein
VSGVNLLRRWVRYRPGNFHSTAVASLLSHFLASISISGTTQGKQASLSPIRPEK